MANQIQNITILTLQTRLPPPCCWSKPEVEEHKWSCLKIVEKCCLRPASDSETQIIDMHLSFNQKRRKEQVTDSEQWVSQNNIFLGLVTLSWHYQNTFTLAYFRIVSQSGEPHSPRLTAVAFITFWASWREVLECAEQCLGSPLPVRRPACLSLPKECFV